MKAIEKCDIQTVRNAAFQKLVKKYGFRGSKRVAAEMQTTVPPLWPNMTQTKKAKPSAAKPQHAKNDDQEEPSTNDLLSDAEVAHDQEVSTVAVSQSSAKTRFFCAIPHWPFRLKRLFETSGYITKIEMLDRRRTCEQLEQVIPVKKPDHLNQHSHQYHQHNAQTCLQHPPLHHHIYYLALWPCVFQGLVSAGFR